MTSARIITLLTDFGNKDPFVGILKGVIASIAPEARTIDLCHEIPRGDIKAASLFLSLSCGYFPAGTVHLAVVDPGVGSARRPVAFSRGGHYFVGPDNGIFSHLLADKWPVRAVILSESRFHLPGAGRSFDGRDIFAPVAAYLASGVPIKDAGRPIKKLKRFAIPYPSMAKGVLTGQVEWVDHFGNLITNLSPSIIAARLQKPYYRCRVLLGKEKNLVKWGNTYCDAPKGGAVAFVNSWDRVEIAINGGSAAEYFRAGKGTEVFCDTKAGKGCLNPHPPTPSPVYGRRGDCGE